MSQAATEPANQPRHAPAQRGARQRVQADRTEMGVEGAPLVDRQGEPRGADRACDLRFRTGADDGRSDAWIRVAPSDHDLRDGRAATSRDRRDHLIQRTRDAAKVSRMEHRCAATPVRRARRPGTREEATTERRVCEERLECVRVLRDRIAREQVVFVLHGRQGPGEAPPALVALRGRHVRDPDRAHLAGATQILEGAESIRERDVAVEVMDLDQVEALHAEPAQTRFDVLAYGLWPTIPSNPSAIRRLEQKVAVVVVPPETDLGQHLYAPRRFPREELPEECFRASELIQRRGVDDIEPSVDRRFEHRETRLVPFRRAAVHRSEDDGWHGEIGERASRERIHRATVSCSPPSENPSSGTAVAIIPRVMSFAASHRARAGVRLQIRQAEVVLRGVCLDISLARFIEAWLATLSDLDSGPVQIVVLGHRGWPHREIMVEATVYARFGAGRSRSMHTQQALHEAFSHVHAQLIALFPEAPELPEATIDEARPDMTTVRRAAIVEVA